MQCIEAKKNMFGGCVVEQDSLPKDIKEFIEQLEYSLGIWKEEGINVVWLSLSIDQAAFIPLCVDKGFIFHHAEENRVQMTLALVPGSFIPPYATHYIGAGGVVIDKDNRLLVVSERYRQVQSTATPSTNRRLKLPGGALLSGEHIAAAVVREVKEETGIDARFEYMACFRHWHNYRYGKSDIYFVCRLTPLSMEIKMDPNEISECLWIPLDDFLNDPDVFGFNKFIVRKAAFERPGMAEIVIPEYNSDTHELLTI